MRITNSMMLSSMMRNMNKNLSRMSKTEEMLSTGKKFSLPSDDPIGVSRSLRLNTDVANMEQYKRNTEDALSWMETTEMAVSKLTDIFHRAKELTTQAANETNSVDERKAIAAEIDQLKEQVISVGNTTYAGSYIFTGYKTNKPLFDEDGKYSLKADATDPAQALKSTEDIEFNVGIGDRMTINFTAQTIFGKVAASGDLDDPIDKTTDIATSQASHMIRVFEQLVTDLEADNTAGINSGAERLDVHFNNLNAIKAEIGVKTNRLDLTVNRIDDDTLNLKNLLSKNEDADMAEVIMNLKMQESVYQASLSGGARIIQPTLIDFLR
ncbi:MAG: flgL [Clostridia bacterium]|nr:flgL [Clostridia bacterium]